MQKRRKQQTENEGHWVLRSGRATEGDWAHFSMLRSTASRHQHITSPGSTNPKVSAFFNVIFTLSQ
jgi:hypothetical protein